MKLAKRRPSKASGAQIGRVTKTIVGCPSCLLTPVGLSGGTSCPQCGDKLARFDSKGEWRAWLTLVNARRAGLVTNLRRQVYMPLCAEGGKKVGALVLHFVFERDGETVYGDYKGGAMTELAAWKMKHFEAQYGVAVTIFGGK